MIRNPLAYELVRVAGKLTDRAIDELVDNLTPLVGDKGDVKGTLVALRLLADNRRNRQPHDELASDL